MKVGQSLFLDSLRYAIEHSIYLQKNKYPNVTHAWLKISLSLLNSSGHAVIIFSFFIFNPQDTYSKKKLFLLPNKVYDDLCVSIKNKMAHKLMTSSKS